MRFAGKSPFYSWKSLSTKPNRKQDHIHSYNSALELGNWANPFIHGVPIITQCTEEEVSNGSRDEQ